MKISRPTIIVFLTGMLLSSGACKNDTPSELFDLTHVVDFTIPAGLNTFDTHFFIIPQVNTLVNDLLDANGLEAEDIGSIKPKRCLLSTIFEDQDLDFIRIIEVRVIDSFNSEIQREVFYLDPAPVNTREVMRPFPGLADVADIISNPSFAIEIRLLFRYPPPQTFDMRMSMEFGAYE